SIIGPGTNFDQAITDVVGGVEIGVNFYLGALANISTVSGFSLGPTGDVLNIADSGWVHSGGGLAGGGTDFSLVVANGSAFVTPGASTVQLITTPGATPGAASVLADGIGTFANAAELQTSLTTTGNIIFNGGAVLIAHSLFHVLVAYGTGTGVNIA